VQKSPQGASANVDRFAALQSVEEESPADRKGSKGYSRGKSDGKGGEKGDPNVPDPRQVFVAGIGSSYEDEIKAHFTEAGDVDRIKVLRTPEGDSRDVCFITFRSEDQAQKALGLHGSSFGGRNLPVRIANGKKGGEKGSGGKGVAPGSPSHGPLGSPHHAPEEGASLPSLGGSLGGSSRFDALGGSQDRLPEDIGGLPPPRSKGAGKSGGRGTGKGKTEWIAELDAELEEKLATQDVGPVKITDFDFTAKRFLSELRGRDRLDGTSRFKSALSFVFEYTNGKDRSAVKKWTAYVFTLLQKYDPDFADDFRKRDEERRRQQLPLRGDDEG
jgi:RNA recognition motif-containing protein